MTSSTAIGQGVQSTCRHFLEHPRELFRARLFLKATVGCIILAVVYQILEELVEEVRNRVSKTPRLEDAILLSFQSRNYRNLLDMAEKANAYCFQLFPILTYLKVPGFADLTVPGYTYFKVPGYRGWCPTNFLANVVEDLSEDDTSYHNNKELRVMGWKLAVQISRLDWQCTYSLIPRWSFLPYRSRTKDEYGHDEMHPIKWIHCEDFLFRKGLGNYGEYWNEEFSGPVWDLRKYKEKFKIMQGYEHTDW